MWKMIYLNFLVFGGILFQGILGSVLEDDLKNSLNLHLRTKRMVRRHTSFGHGDYMFTGAIHIVQILKGTRQVATGVIVTPEHILAADAFSDPKTMYTIQSGAPGRGPIMNHRIISDIPFPFLVLLLIEPRITDGSPFNLPILPAAGGIPEGLHPTIISWGPGGHVRPILQVQIQRITETHVYTVPSHEEHSRCSTKDRGSALVVGDRLFAVLVQAGYPDGLPDMFILVNHNIYYWWLMRYIQLYLNTEPHLYNPAR